MNHSAFLSVSRLYKRTRKSRVGISSVVNCRVTCDSRCCSFSCCGSYTIPNSFSHRFMMLLDCTLSAGMPAIPAASLFARTSSPWVARRGLYFSLIFSWPPYSATSSSRCSSKSFESSLRCLSMQNTTQQVNKRPESLFWGIVVTPNLTASYQL